MDINSLKNHIVYTSHHEMDDICKPLSKIGINYFSFVRSFQDGSHIRLSNNPRWTEHYYQRQFYNVILKQVPDSEGNILWSSIDKYPLFYEAAEYFDVDNGTVVVLTHEDVVERYFFGSTRENKSVNHIYLHQFDLLKKFILYFKYVGNRLIEKANKSRIIVPRVIEENLLDKNIINEFLEDIKIDKICVRFHSKDIYITKNEGKLLALMKSGYTAKEISKEIGLKTKTVEIYKDKLKNRLSLYTKGNLISLAKSNSLLDLNIIS